MRLKFAYSFVLLVILALGSSAVAQEGHPLTGTWYGDFGATATQRNDLTVVLNWDGKAVKGIINPGPDVIQVGVATLNSTDWTVHFEANAKNKAGGEDRFVFDGKIENVVAGNRTISGTWKCGTTSGTFRLRRD
jgi:hypothetical protein